MGFVLADQVGIVQSPLARTPRSQLVAGGRRRGVPWCVWCNSRLHAPVGHRSCLGSLARTVWEICRECFGGGIDEYAGSCFVCHGVGFISVDDRIAQQHAEVLGLADGVNW